MTSIQIAERILAKFQWVQEFNEFPSLLKFDLSLTEPKNTTENIDWFLSDKKQIIEVIQLCFEDKPLWELENEVNALINARDLEDKNCIYLIAVQYWPTENLLDN